MLIPDFQSLLLPILRVLVDGQEHHLGPVRELLAEHLQLSPSDLTETERRSGSVRDRAAWAVVYLKRGHAVSSPSRGTYRIEDRGRALLARNVARLTLAVLRDGDHPEALSETKPEAKAELTPEEQLEQIVQDLQDELAEELLEENAPDLARRLRRAGIEVIASHRLRGHG